MAAGGGSSPVVHRSSSGSLLPAGGATPSGTSSKASPEKPLLVLKVGTSTLLSSDDAGWRIQLGNVAKLVELIHQLKSKGYQVVLISSGAVGMGCIKLGIPKPKDLRVKQAVAAAGQSQLMRMYEDMFSMMKIHVAQLLLSQSDFLEREHWSNVRHTIYECLALGLVPVINENDSTNTEELRFGDNDNLAALTAVQLAASGLFLFTDVDFLYTANPRADPSAKPLRVVEDPSALQVDTSAAGSGLGTGGMSTKILAARTASTAGIPCGLINGVHPERLHTFLQYLGESESGELPEGTYFHPKEPVQTVGDTRRWILALPAAGTLTLDDGAVKAVGKKKSLLPAGISRVEGSFMRNEAVRLVHAGAEIGRAIVSFSAEELSLLKGRKSAEFEQILSYACKPEACFRDNIVLTAKAPE